MPLTILSFARKQIWPHVLTAARLMPERVFPPQRDDSNESKGSGCSWVASHGRTT